MRVEQTSADQVAGHRASLGAERQNTYYGRYWRKKPGFSYSNVSSKRVQRYVRGTSDE